MKFFDGVGQVTTTTGTGTITLGAAIDSSYFTFAEQGAVSTDQVYYRIDEGGDVEIGIGTLGTSAGTLSRDTVLKSRIGGTAGTTKMTLGGAARVLCVAPSVVFADIFNKKSSQSASGTFVDFTSVEPDVGELTLIFSGVSLSGTSHFRITTVNGTDTFDAGTFTLIKKK